jgi:hypothetical protein
MAELEPGSPDENQAGVEFEPDNPAEWTVVLKNWLSEAHSPVGTLLPPGIDPEPAPALRRTPLASQSR